MLFKVRVCVLFSSSLLVRLLLVNGPLHFQSFKLTLFEFSLEKVKLRGHTCMWQTGYFDL